MSMIKRATGKIEKFTNAEGEEVDVDNSVVWADEKETKNEVIAIKDELVIPLTTEMDLDPNASDEDDSVIAKDC
jgi:ribosome maturation factor RimP